MQSSNRVYITYQSTKSKYGMCHSSFCRYILCTKIKCENTMYVIYIIYFLLLPKCPKCRFLEGTNTAMSHNFAAATQLKGVHEATRTTHDKIRHVTNRRDCFQRLLISMNFNRILILIIREILWLVYLKCATYIYLLWARGSVVGWGTMLQAGRSRVRIPMRSLDFSIDLTLPAALWPWSRPSV
jgi:hypothetical protein